MKRVTNLAKNLSKLGAVTVASRNRQLHSSTGSDIASIKNSLKEQVAMLKSIVGNLLSENSHEVINKPELALALIRGIEKLNCNYYSSILNDITKQFESNEYSNIISCCERVIKELETHRLSPELKKFLVETYVYQGRILRQGTKEERDSAASNFKKALELLPSNQGAAEELRSLQLERGELPNASIYYT